MTHRTNMRHGSTLKFYQKIIDQTNTYETMKIQVYDQVQYLRNNLLAVMNCFFSFNEIKQKQHQNINVKMRRQFEQEQNFRTSTQFSQINRGGAKPNPPIDSSRRSTTPSRIQDRVSNSPLKAPLQNAINKAVKPKQNDFERTSMSRGLGKSSYRTESPIVSMSKKIYYQQDPQTQQQKGHPETTNFIKKYFDSLNQEVPLQRFIQRIMQQYQSLWGTQNADKIFDDFTYKIADIFGNDYVDLRQLLRLTKEDGMIGLILRIFKQIKNEENTRSSNYVSFTQNPQVVNISRSFQQKLQAENQSVMGIKNVIQQFMETMYQAMENQVYQKFNIEMRRMILKYKEAQKLLKKVNEKINGYADIFDFDAKLRQKERQYRSLIEDLTKQKQKATFELEKQREHTSIERRQKQKMSEQISKLRQTLQKYQNVVLNKAMEHNSTEASLIRQNSSQSRINQKPIIEPLKASHISNCEPFKITIDTHVVHKQNMVPQTKTVTTFHNAPPLSTLSPRPLQRESYENRTIQDFKTPAAFTTSRVTTYRPVSPVPLSPYHSRIVRPL